MRTALLGLIRLYQFVLSPLKGPTCRFHPTCSEYTRRAVILYGSRKGLWMGLKRVCRCHPFHPGGYDPVVEPAVRD